METQKKSLEEKNARMQELQMEFNPQEKAAVIVKGEVYPGTTIIIGDSSMQVKNTYLIQVLQKHHLLLKRRVKLLYGALEKKMKILQF